MLNLFGFLCRRRYHRSPSTLAYSTHARPSTSVDEPIHEAHHSINTPEALQLWQDYKTLRTVDRGREVPDKINEFDFLALLRIPSKEERLVYLKYLRKRERGIESDLRRQANKVPPDTEQSENFLKLVRLCPYYIPYHYLEEFHKRRAIINSQFTPTIALDLSFMTEMCLTDRKFTLVRLQNIYSANRIARFPCNLYFTEVNPQLDFWRRGIGKLDLNPRFLTITEKDIGSIFPVEKIIYLTPDAKETLETVDYEKVYVLGAICDRLQCLEKATISKAEKLGVKTAKLPIDVCYRTFRVNRKIPLVAVVDILRDVGIYGSWEKALRAFSDKRRAHSMTWDEIVMQHQKQDIRTLREAYLEHLLRVDHLLKVL